jgi:hypothetical protein
MFSVQKPMDVVGGQCGVHLEFLKRESEPLSILGSQPARLPGQRFASQLAMRTILPELLA